MILKRFYLFIIICLMVTFICGCNETNKTKIIIYHASSMARILDQAIQEYEKIHPNVTIVRHSAGDVIICRKIIELGADCDILVNADYKLVEELLFPTCIDWQILFATNRLVIAYNNMSKYNDLINSENWYKILLEKDVSFGRTDENLCPLGYRTKSMLSLGEKYYNISGFADSVLSRIKPSGIAKDSGELMPALECSHLDYVFQYYSLAKQHKQRIINLPPEIDLGHAEHEKKYSKSSVELSWARNKKIRRSGELIKYSYSITKNSKNPDKAADFLKFLLSSQGKNIVKRNYQKVLEPFEFMHKENIPENILINLGKEYFYKDTSKKI